MSEYISLRIVSSYGFEKRTHCAQHKLLNMKLISRKRKLDNISDRPSKKIRID